MQGYQSIACRWGLCIAKLFGDVSPSLQSRQFLLNSADLLAFPHPEALENPYAFSCHSVHRAPWLSLFTAKFPLCGPLLLGSSKTEGEEYVGQKKWNWCMPLHSMRHYTALSLNLCYYSG